LVSSVVPKAKDGVFKILEHNFITNSQNLIYQIECVMANGRGGTRISSPTQETLFKGDVTATRRRRDKVAEELICQ
jgi:hypothetical protein